MEREGQEIIIQLLSPNLNLWKASKNIDIYINPFLRVEIKKWEREENSPKIIYIHYELKKNKGF